MLPKNYRLNLAKEFSAVKRTGFALHQTFFTLLVRRNNSNEKRFGFVVSTKVGKAYIRNRARRLLREAVKANLIKVPAGFDLVLIGHPKIKQASYEELNYSFNNVLSKITKP